MQRGGFLLKAPYAGLDFQQLAANAVEARRLCVAAKQRLPFSPQTFQKLDDRVLLGLRQGEKTIPF